MQNTSYLTSIYNTFLYIPNLLGFGFEECDIEFNAVHPGDHLPLTHQKVDFVSKVLFFNVPIGSYETDQNGKIRFSYHCFKHPFQSNQTIEYKIFEEALSSKSAYINPKEERLIQQGSATIPIGHGQIQDVEVELYEYEKEFPRYKSPSDPSKMPQQWNLVDYYRLITAQIEARFHYLLGLLTEIYSGPLTTEQIRNITNADELHFKVSEKSTLDICLNGICPNLKQIGDNQYLSEIDWKNYAFEKDEYALNMRLYAKKNEKGSLEIEKIETVDRFQNEKTYYPKEKNFNEILFKYNSQALAKGSLAHHLTTHMEGEQYAVAICRHINRNPIGNLLKPFLRGLLQINQLALTAIVGVLGGAGLKKEGIWENIEDVLKEKCWSNPNIPEPLCPEHRLALASKEYWSCVEKGVDLFFNSHLEEIKKYWYEIQAMSQVLVKHSFTKNQKELQKNPNQPLVKSIKPITTQDIPEEQDIDHLKQFCTYLIYNLTWGHTTLHNSEDIGLDLMFATLAPEGYSKEEASVSKMLQVRVGETLGNFKGGFMLDNPNGDIPHEILEQFNHDTVKNLFKEKYGYNLEEIFLGIII